jgi:exopolyphosphatase/guanosine-5'-triphosphate,3'-diphosphate pyrophosphatase
LEWLKEALVSAGDLKKVSLPGLREDRMPVIAGGTAIMSGVFAELGLKHMTVAEGALRQGVLWDLLGRSHQRDIREVTVEQFAHRYRVDLAQAQRVARLASALLTEIDTEKDEDLAGRRSYLDWAAKLHEIGMSIAQGAYHKHSAYILANADMPGFSRQGQAWLSNLVLSQRGKLTKMRPAFDEDPRLAPFAFCLRLAVIFYRSRRNLKLPKMKVSRNGKEFHVAIDAAWLEDHSLAAIALEAEKEQWVATGYKLDTTTTA